MKFTKEDIKNIKEQLCPICNMCDNREDSHIEACPKSFNWKLGYKSGNYGK